MTTYSPHPGAPRGIGDPIPAPEWLGPALLGLCFAVMYAPMYLDVATTLWTTDDEAHGPLILLISLWLAWRTRARFLNATGGPSKGLGAAVFGVGLLTYVLGTALDIVNFQLLSQLLVLAGLILLMRGRAALRVMAFPLLFLLFMFPIPPFIIDALTQPLKGWVSWAADQILYSAGYPIARQGVMLTIGQYQLLVADACSGLRSLVSLGALAVLYIHISARTSLLHRGLMVASIVPLALIANLVRVIALVLITYYLGDAAGQGFLHGAAGMVLFLVAMLCLIGWDQLLSRLLPHAKPAA